MAIGHGKMLLAYFIIANITGLSQALLGDCPGCRRPAPPKCCPPTCPRCLPISKRHRPDLFRDPRSDSLPVSIRQRNRLSGPIAKHSAQKSSVAKRAPLLDEQDFYRIDDWAVPREECAGPDCACADCVCCFTETKLFATTTTCTATETSTTFLTSTFTSTFLWTALTTVTNKIKFIVTNNLEFISTISEIVTASEPVRLTFNQLSTFTSVTQMYMSITTELGAIGTVYSSLPNGPTVTIGTGSTTISSSVALSVYEPYIILVTSFRPTTSEISLRTIPVFGCQRLVTFSLNDTLSLTGTLTPPVTALTTPLATYIDASTWVTSTSTLTETFTKCPEEPITTVRYTPTRTIVAETVTPVCSAPADIGCPVCVAAI